MTVVHNYDFHLNRFEGTQLKTAWHEKKVIAVSDCLIGMVKTVLLAPDRTTVVTNASYATNHQGTEMWTEIPLYSNTRERAIYLDDLLSKGFSGEALIHAFLKPPLYNHGFSTGFGTLYTSAYLPTEGLVKMYWPSAKVIQSFDKFTEVNKLITLI